MNYTLNQLSDKLQNFSKENLSDILHFASMALKDLFQCKLVRVYLEDLYEGMLICHYVTGMSSHQRSQFTQHISPKGSLISESFYKNEVITSWNLPENTETFKNPVELKTDIRSTAVFPIIYQLRPIGTICLDWEEEGQWLTEEQIDTLSSFLSGNSAVIERAKRFHQKISFSKHLDLARKKEAAWRMVRSAVKLIDKLTLASVLIPASSTGPGNPASDQVEVLAVFSKNREDATVYLEKHQMSVLNEKNLINRIVSYDEEKGLIGLKPSQESVYIKNIMKESFERKSIASQIDLKSLYQIPKFNNHTQQLICAVNYFTSTPYVFSDSEKRLLQEHASMVEKLILEDSLAHIEIEVLSEIEELLSDQDTSLQYFLLRILDKTSELIGADCGTISILKIIDNKSWLIVEDEKGRLIGAKSRGWNKSKIPLLPVGGNELEDNLKSLNGYCAHTARPILANNVYNKLETQSFYKNLSSSIQAELAVPIISGNSVLGVINQDSFRRDYFTEEHKNILQIVARLISQKVFNLKQIQELREDMNHFRKDIEYRDPKVTSYHFGNVIGKSRKMNNLIKQTQTVVKSICVPMLRWEHTTPYDPSMGLPCMLVTGQTGTGKEFFFNNVFSLITEIFSKEKGPGFKLPLKKTNIAAYSGDLTYSELFGHKKGAFTGAESNRQGILEEANGGVVFLDEIGDADPKTQVQLLRFLDTGVFIRLGENQPRYSRIFLIAATNKNLQEEINKGHFREDLYHRLNALSFHLPPLNERREDIRDLAIHFLGRLFETYNKRSGEDKSLPYIEPEAIDYLEQYYYRGNVRELKNILFRATLFSQSPTITRKEIMSICGDNTNGMETATSNHHQSAMELLDALESGDDDFWTAIHQPFKKKQITRDTLKSLILTAKSRYQTNLPGLAVKLKACLPQFQKIDAEKKKFVSFKNFLYKTVKITVD